MTFEERKESRKEWYLKYLYGWKLRKCTACNGSGYYDSDDSPSCDACEGTGKERYKPEKELNEISR
jgi:DnaJ-class molecular chaperone